MVSKGLVCLYILEKVEIWSGDTDALLTDNRTRPSILCVTQKRAFMPLYIVLGQQRACMPVYFGKSGDLVE